MIPIIITGLIIAGVVFFIGCMVKLFSGVSNERCLDCKHLVKNHYSALRSCRALSCPCKWTDGRLSRRIAWKRLTGVI